MQIAELEKQDGFGQRHLRFRSTRPHENTGSALSQATMLRADGQDVFIWDGETLPLDTKDPMTQQVISCVFCLEDIQEQNNNDDSIE